jgi:uncharacterized protein with HEPN domain
MARSPVARLTDIVEAIELLREVERGIEIVSEASRHLGADLKARHPEIPWPKVAGIGNMLRHAYETVAHDVLWHVVRDNLPPLEQVCRAELTAAQAREGWEADNLIFW